MAELAFGLAQTLLEKLSSIAYEEISLAKSAKTDLGKLSDTVSELQSVLNDAEKKQKQGKDVERWVIRLKDALHDAVDVLDEFECEALRRRVVRDFAAVGRKVRRFFSSSNPALFRFSIAHRIKEVKERLDEITRDMAQFGLIRAQLGVGEESSHLSDREKMDRMTHSFVRVSEVIGREDDKAAIVDMLMLQNDRSEDGESLSVIPIVGLGGLGKTTLAKLVFNDGKVNEKFDLTIWVCVSLEFDVHRLLRDILKEILKSTTNSDQDLSGFSYNQLQASVREKLRGQNFLLVLDDVWSEDRIKWLDLKECLTGGADGSKMIITTRSTRVSSKMTDTPPYKLEGLSVTDSFSLFFKCAFKDEKRTGCTPMLEAIGKDIAKKCGGVPLALKTLGGLLCSKSVAKWISIRDSEIWELEQEDDRILPALRLSYMTMSSSMKQCFTYCSIYPEDATMWSDDLILYWMALGFLQSYEKMELEDIGELQFQELCERGFFQCDRDKTHYDFSYTCTMHDLIHNLACLITKSECSIVKPDQENISNNIRYLRLFWSQRNLKCVQGLDKLWSLHIGDGESESTIDEFSLSTCIRQLKYLRVFDLRHVSFEVLPSSIGTLKHLRYLNLSRNERIKRLPISLYKLQSLQTLLLYGCSELVELPRDVRKLVSLRTIWVTTKQTSFPENGIGCLKSLQTLDIEYCENLKTLPHDMIYCTALRTLVIAHCDELDLSIKDNEAKLASLQRVSISDLPRMTNLPQWLQGASHTLQFLVIRYCENLASLPEWLPDLTSLLKLVIEYCRKLRTLPAGMSRLTSLAHLTIRGCSTEFEKRYEREVGEDWHNIAHVPHLRIGYNN